MSTRFAVVNVAEIMHSSHDFVQLCFLILLCPLPSRSLRETALSHAKTPSPQRKRGAKPDMLKAQWDREMRIKTTSRPQRAARPPSGQK
jgi:hypothetical protein